MHLSCPEQMLQSHHPAERLRVIRESGFDGVDCRFSSLGNADCLAAREESGLPLASVYSHIRTSSLLDPDVKGRAQAIDDAVEIDRVGGRLALVHLSDSGRRLPGEDEGDFRAVCCRLAARGYAGCQAFECRQLATPEDERAPAESVAMLRSIECPA